MGNDVPLPLMKNEPQTVIAKFSLPQNPANASINSFFFGLLTYTASPEVSSTSSFSTRFTNTMFMIHTEVLDTLSCQIYTDEPTYRDDSFPQYKVAPAQEIPGPSSGAFAARLFIVLSNFH